MNRKYTHIFFDLDNTLWDFETNSQNAMKVVFSDFNLSEKVDFNIFYKVYSKHNHQLWERYRNNEINKKELTKLRFQLTFDELKIENIDPVLMNTNYLDVMPEQRQLKKGVIELLQYLKRKAYKISIITNGFKEVQNRKIETSGLKPFIANIFISEVVKISKPDRRIFEYAVKSSNARKNQSLMIGDDWEVDILGAAGFGIDAVLLVSDEKENLALLENPLNSKCRIYKVGSLQTLNNML